MKEIRVQFDQPIQSALQVQTKLFLLAKEANQKLQCLPIDQQYHSPGDSNALFKNPNSYILTLALCLWIGMIYLSFVDEIPSSLDKIRHHLRGKEGMQRILLSVCIIHLLECVVAIGFWTWSKLPLDIILKYLPLIFILGIASLKDCIRAAYRHHSKEFSDIK